MGDFLKTAAEQYTAMKSAIGPLRVSWLDLLILFLRRTKHNLTTSFVELTLPFQLLTLLLIFLSLLILQDRISSRFRSLSRTLDIPVLQPPAKLPFFSLERWNYERLMKEGARQFPNQVYIIKEAGIEYVVFPSSCFEQVKRLPASQASLVEWQHSTVFTGWHVFAPDNSPMYKMISTDLARASSQKARERHRGARDAVARTFDGHGSEGEKGGWKKFYIYSSLLDVVTVTNSTGLVPNTGLANDPRWLKCLQRLPVLVMLAHFFLYALPRPIRPLFASLVFLPARYTAWRVKQLLRPSLVRDFEEYFGSHSANSAGGKEEAGDKGKREGITSWLLTRYHAQQKQVSIDEIADDYVRTIYFANPSTSATIYNIFVEMITRPELMEELREEVDQVVNAAGNSDGLLSHADLQKLHKLDSFMREAVRTRQFLYLSVGRKTMQPLQLSVGPLLPKDTLVCVDAYHVNNSSEFYHDPAPELFDPMRSYRARFPSSQNTLPPTSHSQQHSGEKGQNPTQTQLNGKKAATANGTSTKTNGKKSPQEAPSAGSTSSKTFASATPDTTHWGGGPQGCPGREFATDTIKLILVEMLARYEIKFATPDSPPERYFMPNGSVAPDMWAGMLVRPRTI